MDDAGTLRRPATAASSASFHRAATSESPERTSGATKRSSCLIASNPKRPLSQSQPQLTGSESTPLYRSTSSREVSIETRQPTEQVVHVDSACSRSHGRALKRYGVAVSAPTGQICTVFPLKYDENGSPGNVFTWVLEPRCMKWMSGSPATSSAKRVQRSHRMQRSRSSCTVAEMAIGFS